MDLNALFICIVQFINKTFCCVENGSRLSTASLPVDTVWQGSHKVLFRALHDLLTHLMKLFGVVDPTVKLCTCVRELCRHMVHVSQPQSEDHTNLSLPDAQSVRLAQTFSQPSLTSNWETRSLHIANKCKHSRSSICGFRACFFCLSVRSASSSSNKVKRQNRHE